MLNNFNSGQVATIRLPISLKFDMDDMYENLIVPARTSRTLTKLIQDLLRLYYENDRVRALVEYDTDFSVDLDDILQQVDDILAAEKETAAYTSILQTQVEGMNEYLEHQHSVLSSSGLESGINGFADFTEESTNDTLLQVNVDDTFESIPDVKETQTDTNSSEMSDMMQVLLQQMDALTKKVDMIEQHGNLKNTASVTVTEEIIEDSIEDISDEDYDVDENSDDYVANTETTHSNVQKAHIGSSMRTPAKKSTESAVTASMAKLMRGMEKM